MTLPLAIAVAGCDRPDSATAPASRNRVASASTVAGASPTCGAICSLFDSPAVLVAAQAHPDSLETPIELANVVLRGRAGDTVAVVLTVDAGVLGSIPQEERLSVDDGASSQSMSLADARNGMTVYRFDRADSVVLHYSLNRRIAAVPTGTAVLVQTTSATVLEIRAPWSTSLSQAASAGHGSRAGALGRTASAAACSNIATFDVPQPGDYCGTSVGFSVYTPAAAFIGLGAQFQNAFFTGFSHPMTITFSPGVYSVEVTAYDPTFAGNTMEAFDGDASVGVAAFPGNNRPGVTTVQTRTLSGHITSITLTPAPNEYIAYSMRIIPAKPATTVSMTCNSSVERGQPAECRLGVTPPESPITVTGWYFVPDALSAGDRVDRSSDQGALSWGGVMAASGTVHATWTSSDGPAVHDVSGHVTVNARNWSGKTIDFPTLQASDNDDMVEQPFQRAGDEGLYHLGHFHSNWVHESLAPGVNLGVINGGPNSGYFYLTGIPVSSEWSIHVNYSQLKATSNLGRIQLENRPAIGSGCTSTDLPRWVQPTELHEGVGLDPKSHAGRTKSKFTELAGPAFEPLIWGPSATDFNSKLKPVLNAVEAAVKAESDKTDQDFKARVPCTIKLFNPPTSSTP